MLTSASIYVILKDIKILSLNMFGISLRSLTCQLSQKICNAVGAIDECNKSEMTFSKALQSAGEINLHSSLFSIKRI